MSHFLLPVAFVASLAVMLGVPTPPAVAVAQPNKPDEELIENIRLFEAIVASSRNGGVTQKL